jgi:hypothetical protein
MLNEAERAFHKHLDEFRLLRAQVNELQGDIDVFKGPVVPADGAGPSALVPAQAADETEVEAEQSGSESVQGRVVVVAKQMMGRRRHSF